MGSLHQLDGENMFFRFQLLGGQDLSRRTLNKGIWVISEITFLFPETVSKAPNAQFGDMLFASHGCPQPNLCRVPRACDEVPSCHVGAGV